MNLKTPAALALSAAAIALAASAFSLTGRQASTSSIETVTLSPGSFAFRLPGEYLRAGRPVDAPMRQVEFRKQIEIMKFQVSVGEYARCVADSTCEAADLKTATGSDLPVTGVSYRDATAYAEWLSGQTGESWRLPTNEEWAFAAADRLVDDALGFEDDGSNPAARWIARYRAETGKASLDAEPRVRGAFGANAKGLFDIAGNVSEWTTTCYVNAELAENGSLVYANENCGVRVVGGPHRAYMSTFIRDGKSGGCAAGMAPHNLGIRLVRQPQSAIAFLKTFWRKG